MDILKDVNIRKTPQSVIILDYLKKHPGHPTVNNIYQNIIKENPNISLATVYNNLKRLSNQKIIQEIYVKNGPSRFDKNPITHYHMVCNKCEKMVDLSYPVLHEIEKFVNNLYNFEVSKHELNIYGVCENCKDYK